MKKLLYILAAVGALICTACDHYDHTLADQGDRLDVLEQSTIKNIDEQIVSLDASLKELEEVDAALEALIETLKAEEAKHADLIAKLQDKDAELDQQIADLKAYIDDELKAAEDWANATFATLEQYKDIQTEISNLKDLLGQQKTDLTKALEDAIAALETSMKTWVNEVLAEGYYDIAAIDAKLETLESDLADADAELAKEITAQKTALEQAKTDLTAAYKQAITDAIETNNGVINKSIADAVQAAMDEVEADLAKITESITAIQTDIEALKGGIKTIEEQITAIKASLKDLEAVDTELDALIAALKTADGDFSALITKLQTKDAALADAINELKAYINTEIKDTEDWASATFATLEQYTTLQDAVADISVLLENQNTDLTKAINDAIAALETSMQEWVNKLLTEKYYDIATIDAKVKALEDADSALSDELEAQKTALADAKTELLDAIKTAITDALAADGAINKAIMDAVRAAQDEIDGELTVINDAIDDIKADIELIKTGITTIEGQITAINTSLASLQDMDKELGRLIDALEDADGDFSDLIAALKEKDLAIDEAISNLKTYVDDELKGTEDWAEATFATLDQYSDLQDEILALSKLLGDQKTELTEALEDAIEDLQTTMEGWVNKVLEDGYYDIAAIDALLKNLKDDLDGADKELEDAIKAQQDALLEAKEKLTEAYEQAIEDAIEQYDGQITEDIADAISAAKNDLQDQIDAITLAIEGIESRLDDLEDAVGELEGTVADLVARIQSIRFVPEYSDGKVELGDATEITFLISPKEVAALITADHVTAYAVRTKVRTKAVATPAALVVTSVAGNESGVLTVTVSDSSLPADFWNEGQTANIYVCISDGNNDVISEMIPVLYTPYLTFSAEAEQTFKLTTGSTLAMFGASSEKFEYSVGGSAWETLVVGDEVTFGGDHGNLRMRGRSAVGTNGKNIVFGNSTEVSCFGDIRTLVDWTNCAGAETDEAVFAGLFKNCVQLVSAPELPATELAVGCYAEMFAGCTNLTKAPELPAAVLTENCYQRMFAGCTNLEEVVIKATDTSAPNCMHEIFGGEDSENDDLEMLVTSEAVLKAAIAEVPEGATIKLGGNFTITSTIDIEKSLTLNLNGKTLTNMVGSGRAFDIVADNVVLTVEAAGSYVEFGNETYGFVQLKNDVDGAVVTINEGVFTGTSNTGSLVRFRNGGNNTVTLKNVTYTDNDAPNGSSNAWVVYSDKAIGKENKLYVNGGTFSTACGFAVSFASEFKGAQITAKALALELKSVITDVDENTFIANKQENLVQKGLHLVEDCTITLSPGGNSGFAPGTCVSASYESAVEVKNCTLNAPNKGTYALAIFNTGGTFNVTNSTINGEFKVDAGKLTIDGGELIFDAAGLDAAIRAGGSYVLANDIAVESKTYGNIDFTLDGCGHTISQVEGSANNFALFDSVTGKLTLKNIVFDGIKDGAVLRTTGAELTLDNVTVQNCEHTKPIYGLFRLIGKNVIKNSTFKNNKCITVITFNTEGDDNTDPQLVQNCEFSNNTCSATAVVHYSTGGGATIDGCKFLNNTLNVSNGATVYLGFKKNCTVTNNIFDGNTVTATSKRSSGGLMVGNAAVVTGNAFVNNTVTVNGVSKGYGNNVCASPYYAAIDLSGNYWGGSAPTVIANGEDATLDSYDVYKEYSNNELIINDFLTSNPL